MSTFTTCHITTVHTRSDIRIFVKQCRSLAKQGTVILICADGAAEEFVEGVRILSTYRFSSRLWRMLFAPWLTLRQALALPAQIIHFHDPELIPCALIFKLLGRQVIYDVHEDVPRQILTKHWIRPSLRKAIAHLIEWLENWACTHFDLIITATQTIAERFQQRKIPHVLTINNYPLLSEIRSHPLPSSSPTCSPNICYVGSITAIRGIHQLVSAIDSMPLRGKLRLILAGPPSPPNFLQELQQLPGWKFVDYRGVVSRSQVQDIFGESLCGILPFLPEPNHIDSSPNKMYEYMAAGLPLVASNFPRWAKLLDVQTPSQAKGVVFDPLSSENQEFINALLWILEHRELAQQMGERGQRLVLEQLSWASEEIKLLNAYRSLL